jgi:hypothetical protein
MKITESFSKRFYVYEYFDIEDNLRTYISDYPIEKQGHGLLLKSDFHFSKEFNLKFNLQKKCKNDMVKLINYLQNYILVDKKGVYSPHVNNRLIKMFSKYVKSDKIEINKNFVEDINKLKKQKLLKKEEEKLNIFLEEIERSVFSGGIR